MLDNNFFAISIVSPKKLFPFHYIEIKNRRVDVKKETNIIKNISLDGLYLIFIEKREVFDYMSQTALHNAFRCRLSEAKSFFFTERNAPKKTDYYFYKVKQSYAMNSLQHLHRC